MLTTELKINGCLIGHLYATRRPGTASFNPTVYRYDYEYYAVEGNIIKGTVEHAYNQGALELVRKIAEDIKPQEEVENGQNR